MAGTVQHARLESPSARNRLKRGRQPHWQALVEGKVHLGYQCWKGEPAGRWVLRRYIGRGISKKGKPVAKYSAMALGLADDAQDANGSSILSFEQAEAKARAMVETTNGSGGKIERLTVRQAINRYVEFKRTLGQPVGDLLSRTTAHVLPVLGNLVVAELTAETLRKWVATMAAQPAQTRPKNGKPQFKAEPEDDEDIRRRRASANRVLTMLKAALNHAYDEGHVANRDTWGRKLKPFKGVEVARVRYLSIAEAQRLINASDAEFRPLVRAALTTGCRYGELVRLQVADFNSDSGSLAIRKSKSGKARHVILRRQCVLQSNLHRPGRKRIDVPPFRWQPLEEVRAGAADEGRLRAREDHAPGGHPPTAPYVGITCRHEWCAVAHRGPQSGPPRHAHVRTALCPSEPRARARCHPRGCPTIRLPPRPASHPVAAPALSPDARAPQPGA
jgi:integrase